MACINLEQAVEIDSWCYEYPSSICTISLLRLRNQHWLMATFWEHCDCRAVKIDEHQASRLIEKEACAQEMFEEEEPWGYRVLEGASPSEDFNEDDLDAVITVAEAELDMALPHITRARDLLANVLGLGPEGPLDEPLEEPEAEAESCARKLLRNVWSARKHVVGRHES